MVVEGNDDVQLIHNKSIVVDFHCDTLKFVVDWPIIRAPLEKRRRLGERNQDGHVDLPKLFEGGINCQVFAVFTTREPRPQDAAMWLLDAFYRELDLNKDKLVLALNSKDILKAKKDGKVSAFLSLEGGEPLLSSLAALRMFYKLGVRAMGLTWSLRNELGNGCNEKKPTGGLSDFGLSVVNEMNRLGMIVDVSHLNDEGFWDVEEINQGPFIASHSNCRALCNISRNLSDDMIIALAKKGGVIGMNFLPFFLVPREEILSGKKATTKDVLNHINHIVELVGCDHIGLGSDFDGINSTPIGLENSSKIPNITKELYTFGYSDEEIQKILGGNFLRVIKTIIN